MLATIALGAVCISLHAQGHLLRSTLSAAGGATVHSADGRSWYLQQSVGQASVAGSFQVGANFYNQGFIQPLLVPVRGLPSTDLDALLFPNPFNDQFTISFAEAPAGPVTVRVYNALGQQVYATDHAADRSIVIQPGPLAAGPYIVHVLVGQRRFIGHIQCFP